MNNGKYYTEEYKQKQAAKIDRRFGPKINHTKQCAACEKEFLYLGRKNTKQFNEARFCCRSCANNRQEWWNENATHYATIAFQHHERRCVICGFDKVVAVHHIDENKKNNDPSNLIPLCPNHHEMYHSRWKPEVEPFIKEWQNKFICS